MTVTTIDRTGLSGNLLIAFLGERTIAVLRPHLRRTVAVRGMALGSGGAVSTVWFPETLVAAINESVGDGMSVDVGLIGREGMIGWPLLLGDGHVSHGATVLLDGGTALAIEAGVLRDLCASHPPLHAALLTFVQSYTVQMAQSIASARRDGVEARLARLLLMVHDRIDGDDLAITHVELSAAMHVRRASVTDCLHVLEGDGVVRCTRGRLIVRDRAKLRQLASGTYGAAESAYTNLIAPFGRG